MSQSAKIGARLPSEMKAEDDLPCARSQNSQRKAAKDRKARKVGTRNRAPTTGVSNSGCHIAFRVRFNQELNHVQQA